LDTEGGRVTLNNVPKEELMKKMTILILLIFSLLGNTEGVYASAFSDIRSPVLLEAVSYLEERNIMKGSPDGRFRPKQKITRAETIKMISNPVRTRRGAFLNRAQFIKMAMLALENYEHSSDSSLALNQFEDLQGSEWYLPYINYALKYGFLDKRKKFKASTMMTRAEAAMILHRIALSQEELNQGSLENSEADDVSEESEFIMKKSEEITAADEREGQEAQHVDVRFSELYRRAIGIQGGKMTPDGRYLGHSRSGVRIKNAQGIPIRDCDCQFEDDLIGDFNRARMGNAESFESWITSEEAKAFISDSITYYLEGLKE